MTFHPQMVYAAGDELLKIAQSSAWKTIGIPAAAGLVGGGLLGSIPTGGPFKGWKDKETRGKKLTHMIGGALGGGALGAGMGAVAHDTAQFNQLGRDLDDRHKKVLQGLGESVSRMDPSSPHAQELRTILEARGVTVPPELGKKVIPISQGVDLITKHAALAGYPNFFARL
jgi:hypothetical protein